MLKNMLRVDGAAGRLAESACSERTRKAPAPVAAGRGELTGARQSAVGQVWDGGVRAQRAKTKRRSLTLVRVGPVTTRASSGAKKR